ncbi:transposase [Mariniphaga sp.]|uniref:transposase n=1 Tax=Mariniphaga sp. TaxID=1954475 RepID=UPI003562C63F
MPANKTIMPLLGGAYFHIFNRGINRNTIFFKPENYDYFLYLWTKHLNDYVDVLVYCLLPNHFHFLIKLSEKIVIENPDNNETEELTNESEVGAFISERLRRLFISYSQAINIKENRTGSLFTRNFKRLMIEEDEYLRYLFFYIHYNPVKHGLTNDFKNYKYSSYQAYISNKPTKISKELGLVLFDGLENFLNFHNYFHEEKSSLNLE